MNRVMHTVMNGVMNGIMNRVTDAVMKSQSAQQSLQPKYRSNRRLIQKVSQKISQQVSRQHLVLLSPKAGARIKRTGFAMLFGLLMAGSGVQATPQEFSDQEIREVGASGTTGSVPGIYIATTNTERSLDGCGAQFFVGAANPLLNQSLAIALSALYTKSHVLIEVDGCQADDAMRIKSIRVAR